MSQAPHEFADQLCMLCHCGSPADCCCSHKHATVLAGAQTQPQPTPPAVTCPLVLCCKCAVCASPRMHCDIELHVCGICQAARAAVPVHQRLTPTMLMARVELASWAARPAIRLGSCHNLPSTHHLTTPSQAHAESAQQCMLFTMQPGRTMPRSQLPPQHAMHTHHAVPSRLALGENCAAGTAGKWGPKLRPLQCWVLLPHALTEPVTPALGH